MLGFYSMRLCSDNRDHYQVEIGRETGPKLQNSRSYYFQVLGAGPYTMLGVSESPDARCTGPDLLDEDHEVK